MAQCLGYLAFVAVNAGSRKVTKHLAHDVLVAGFLAGRERVLTRLAGLSATQWERTGFHPEWGRITVRQQLGYLAHHEQSHLAELAARCGEAGDARRSERA